MALRLILVGLVAGLGLSLPSRSDFDTLTRSTKYWINARLAEWQLQTSSDRGTYVFTLEPAPTFAPNPAPTALALTTTAPIADEGFAEVLDETIATFAQEELAGQVRATDQVVMSRNEWPLPDPVNSLSIDLPAEPAFALIDDPTLPELVEMPGDQTDRDVPAEVADLEASDPSDLSFEGVLEETVIRFTRDASTVVLAEADRTPRGEPLEIGEDLYEGEAYALNRLSDGISIRVSSGSETGKGPNRLTNAVRLTREAVFAWARLLHGPAIITIAP